MSAPAGAKFRISEFGFRIFHPPIVGHGDGDGHGDGLNALRSSAFSAASNHVG